jgi:hypothetical protein
VRRTKRSLPSRRKTQRSWQEPLELRRELVEREPGIDDSDMAAPNFASQAWMNYDFSLARFDEVAAHRSRKVEYGFPPLPDHRPETGPVPHLLNILRGKLHQLRFGGVDHLHGHPPNQRPDLDDLAERLIGRIPETLALRTKPPSRATRRCRV